MKRWKLWTGIASGLMSVAGGSTYVWWNRNPAPATAEVAAAEAEQVSPHALRPEPLRDDLSQPSAAQFASPASYHAPTDDGSGMPDADRFGNGDALPVRPSAIAAPSDFRVGDNAPSIGPVMPSPDFDPASPVQPASELVPVDATNYAVSEAGAEVVAAEGDSQAAPDSPDMTIAAEASAAPSALGVAPVPPGAETVLPIEESPVAESSAPLQPLAAAPGISPVPSSDASQDPPASAGSRYDNLPRDPAAAGGDEAPRPFQPSLRSSAPNSVPNGAEESAPRSIGVPAGIARSGAPRTSLVSNSPGERKFEGVQTPSLTVERAAPEEIQVGKPAKFVIRVRNVGSVAAQEVVVSDQVPQGTRFLSANPEIVPTPEGVIAWELGELQPGEDAILTVELMPEAEGEIGSVAAVTFRTPAAVRTIATKPLLKVEHTGPARVLIGDDAAFQITVSNPGSGIATGVVVEVDVPEGFAHDGGREIMSDQFDLRPNESRKIDLLLKAVAAGSVESVVRAVGSGTLASEHRAPVEVIAPQLQVGTVGATRRFLDRPVKYQVIVANPGTAPAREVDLIAHLPRSLKFVSADKKGQYDSRQHAVLWSLEELPEGEQGVVELTCLPTSAGEQKLHIEGRRALGLQHQHEHITLVEEITDLLFTVTDENVPIEVGSETTYEIRIANNGTKVARNVRLSIQIPEGLEVVDADGPTLPEEQGGLIVTQPLAELRQNEDAVYRLTTKGLRPGDHLVRVQLHSDEFSTPVTKEEVTKVYSDK